MSVRKVITRRSNHFRAVVPSRKNPIPTHCESILEARLARLLELSGMVTRFSVQPSLIQLRVGQETQRYFPDAHAYLVDGTDIWLEVKPVKRLSVARVSARMSAAKFYFMREGSQFHIITDEWLYREPRCSNVAMLMYQRRQPLHASELEAIKRHIAASSPATLADLQQLIGVDLAWRLLGEGVVGVDLEKDILMSSVIFLLGGHRHADFRA